MGQGILSMSDEIVFGKKSRPTLLPAFARNDMRFGAGAGHTFGVILRRLRRGRGITRDEFADSVGISVECLSKIEGGYDGLVDFDLIVKIKDALQFDYKDLVSFR